MSDRSRPFPDRSRNSRPNPSVTVPPFPSLWGNGNGHGGRPNSTLTNNHPLGNGQHGWMAGALCAESIHHERNFESTSSGEISRCLALCGQCTVRERCRQFADEIEDTSRVLGGEDPAARRARWRVRGRLTTSERNVNATS